MPSTGAGQQHQELDGRISTFHHGQPEGALARLPCEITFTILASCHPVSLLMLARTSKAWRKIVASPNSLKLWEGAFAACGLEMPFKSDDRNLMQWANHIWLKVCAVCSGPAPTSSRVDEVRVCDDCLKVCYRTEQEVREYVKERRLSREWVEGMRARQGDAHADVLFDFWNEMGDESNTLCRSAAVEGVGSMEKGLSPEPVTASDSILDIHPESYKLATSRFYRPIEGNSAESRVRAMVSVISVPALLISNDILLLLEELDCKKNRYNTRARRQSRRALSERVVEYVIEANDRSIARWGDTMEVLKWTSAMGEALCARYWKQLLTLKLGQGGWDDRDIEEAWSRDQIVAWHEANPNNKLFDNTNDVVLIERVEAAKAKRVAAEQAAADAPGRQHAEH